MMGRKGSVGKLFYQFSLEERVPQDHLLRRVLAAVDFSFVRRTTARFYSHTGQPSIDPVVIFRMALISYLYGITSERRLVQEIRLNLAYLWFIGYDLDESVPDHSVLSKARARFGPTVYLGFFKEIVRQCEQAGLVRGDKVYLDSTLVEANASIDSVGSRALVSQLPDANEHVRKLWEDNSDQAPGQDNPTATTLTPVPLPAVSPVAPVAQEPTASDEHPELVRPTESVSATQSAVPTSDSGGEPTPAQALHVAGPEDPPNRALGAFNERMVSRVDPEAEVVSRARVVPDLYYKVHAAVDAGRARIVTAVEVTGGGVTDEQLLKRLVLEHEGNVGRHLNEVGADTKYGTVDIYRWLEGQGIRASITMTEQSTNRRALPPGAFEYDLKSDSYRCPNGERLTRQGTTTTKAGLVLVQYRARPKCCALCPRKAECCAEAEARTISVADDGGIRDRVRAYLTTFQARQSIRRRKAWIETIFGDGKERRGLRRARCRGLDWMRVQAWMTAIAQNVRQLALRKGTRPETGMGALEKLSPVPFFLSLLPLQLANTEPNHNLTLSLSLN
jgi:transposase